MHTLLTLKHLKQSDISTGQPKVRSMAIALGDIAKGEVRHFVFTGGMIGLNGAAMESSPPFA